MASRPTFMKTANISFSLWMVINSKFILRTFLLAFYLDVYTLLSLVLSPNLNMNLLLISSYPNPLTFLEHCISADCILLLSLLVKTQLSFFLYKLLTPKFHNQKSHSNISNYYNSTNRRFIFIRKLSIPVSIITVSHRQRACSLNYVFNYFPFSVNLEVIRK
jgi:hypothetical protein